MDPLRVVVTGAGSGVGQGIVKALRLSRLPLTLIAADIAPLNAGLYRADESLIWPKVESEGALAAIIAVLRARKADALLIGSEFDLAFFAAHRAQIEQETGTRIVVSPPETVAIADDKLATVRFLQEHGLPYAPASAPKDLAEALSIAEDWSYPVMLKTRRGTSSRHVHLVRDAAQLRSLFASVPLPMLQVPIAIPSDELDREYTTSVFVAADGTRLGPFTARRRLRGGESWHVEVDDFTELHGLILGVAERLQVVGSLNIQLMIGAEGPVPFELNARFSGTTAVRAHFGFNEPEMAIRSYLLGETPPAPTVGRGVALRYVEEVFLDDVAANELGQRQLSGQVHPWF